MSRNLLDQTTPLSGYSKSLHVLYQTHGSWRQRLALWRADRARGKVGRPTLGDRLGKLLRRLSALGGE